MKVSELRARLKPWMLPIAMVTGVVAHNYMERAEAVAPVFIFVMLLITFCRVSPRELRVTRLSGLLLAVQLGGAVAVYAALRPVSEPLAQGMFICFFCPTATAAPVITGMLGGSVPRLVTYSIIINVVVALLAPPAFSLIAHGGAELTLTQSVAMIASKVVPLILMPLAVAFLLQWKLPKVHHAIGSRQDWSFYIWALSLVIVVGRAVSFVMHEPARELPLMIALAVGAGLMCGVQFAMGRRIGARCGDRIAGAQALGQKNTVLAIWMALTFLDPVASVAPAAYIAWQNTFNSLQLYLHDRKARA